MIGATSAAAVAFGVLPFSPAPAAIADICPGPGQTDRFTDDTGTTHEANINCAAAYGFVSGKTATTYVPNGDLTRGQAATLVVNYVEEATGTLLVADATADFTDTAGDTHAANIEKAADNNILSGFSDRTFRPGLPVSRAQFATLIVRATERALGSALVANATNEFDDDNGSVHEVNIEKAVDNGILVGTAARTFSPLADVSRGQAASIVISAAGNVLQPAGKFAPATTTTTTTQATTTTTVATTTTTVATTTTTTVPDTTITSASLLFNDPASDQTLLDLRDVFTITFSTPVTGAATGSYTLTDAGGSTGTFICGEPGCTYDAGNNTLSATVNGLPPISGDGDFDLPVTITAVSNVTGANGQPATVGSTGDHTIG